MGNLSEISIVIPTRDRPKDLAELLLTILDQDFPPLEVIIIDDSKEYMVKQVANLFKADFEKIGCKLKYIKGYSDGLPSARNLGVELSRGDIILFLDDDTLLDKNVVGTLVDFLRENPKVIGVQPKISSLSKNKEDGLARKFERAVYKALMLTYQEDNRLIVRRSGMSIFPNDLTRIISAQRLSGCCCCYKRSIFNVLRFDTNLKLWAFMEDLDFSYRVYKKSPHSLYVIPHAKIIHKSSRKARLPKKVNIYLITIYWFYIFFKTILNSSILNLIAFLWGLVGKLVVMIGGLIIKRKEKEQWWSIIHLLNSYIFAFKNLRLIRKGDLDFFNRRLPSMAK